MTIFMYFPTTTFHTTMPGIMSEQGNTSIFGPQLRKRKRDPIQPNSVDIPTATKLIPSTLHTLNGTFRLDYPNLSCDIGEPSSRQRCCPRKRRVLQQAYIHPQLRECFPNRPSPLPESSTAQVKLLSPNVCVPATSNISSPPISPKTLVPQRNTCAPASCLRPCHICHRRPTTKEVLDAYADCGLCGERSCYICLRQCDAAHCSGSAYLLGESHLFRGASEQLQEETGDSRSLTRQSRKICSYCSVEGVTETGLEVVRCLVCVRNHLSHWQPNSPGLQR
ncbi:hypothetical protein BDV23DRAFT_165254 [Aspergillus alliaceus]|uniref:Uncharacterized protein n=1 Tax=Petromyces alliaceus TaxID=209559 RepID=A0A5N7BTS9_PETAA|nr:uncharacterized protein BDW43DRAFT_293143 [Aspergillus alliaceus]KAB8227820.1 hypothetical protein BDW43DRAFT_293143 [Aspergillus alliaceus]KAE8385245.1 hypothetical protein BDV23DRAFT_165254 [Aspergillus alliaceus]